MKNQLCLSIICLTLTVAVTTSSCGGGSGTFAGPLLNGVPTSTNQNVVLVSGSKPAGTGVQMNNGLITPIDSSTEFSLAVTLQPGINHLVWTLLDANNRPSSPEELFIQYLDGSSTAAPHLLAPAADARPMTLFPNFQWTSAGAADGIELFVYRLELSLARDFAAPIASYSTSTTLHLKSPTPLAGGSYFWRVCAQPRNDATAAFNCSAPRLFFLGRNPSDINGDGYGDAVIGAPHNDFYDLDAGAVGIVFGGDSNNSNSSVYSDLVDQRIVGLNYQGNFGSAIGQGIDVNGDGVGDLLVGEPGAVGSGAAGQVLIYLGSNPFPYGADSALLAADGYVGFGRSLALVGDLNGDGYEDVAVGAPDSSTGGVVDIFAGSANGGLTYFTTLRRPVGANEPQQLPDKFGTAVTRLGDFNGDGYSDLAVGAPGLFGMGAVYIYFGGPQFDNSADAVIVSPSASQSFGATLAGGLDWNGDGFADLIVGAPQTDGQATIYFGGATDPNLRPSVTLRGSAPDAALASSLLMSSANDETSTTADLLIGSPGRNSGDGAVIIFKGRPVAPIQAPLPDDAKLTLTSLNSGEHFGSSLATVSWFNGTDALVIGSPTGLLDQQYSFRPGTVDLLQSDLLSPLRHFAGENDSDLFGFGLGSFR